MISLKPNTGKLDQSPSAGSSPANQENGRYWHTDDSASTNEFVGEIDVSDLEANSIGLNIGQTQPEEWDSDDNLQVINSSIDIKAAGRVIRQWPALQKLLLGLTADFSPATQASIDRKLKKLAEQILTATSKPSDG